MVILGGLELVAAGYLINRHQKNKQEERRIREEEDLLEEQRYQIHSADNAGPGRRRSHSHDRHDRKHSHHRHHSHDRRHSRDDRRDDRKYNYERPQRESRPHANSAPPPVYAAAVPIAAQAVRPAAPPAMAPARPPVSDPSYPPTGWPAHWEQSQRPPVNPQPQPQAAQMPPNLTPYYRDPAQSDVKYGFQDEEDDRGRASLRPSDANRGVDGRRSRSRRGSSSRSVRFDLPDRRQPGDEPPPAYRP